MPMFRTQEVATSKCSRRRSRRLSTVVSRLRRLAGGRLQGCRSVALGSPPSAPSGSLDRSRRGRTVDSRGGCRVERPRGHGYLCENRTASGVARVRFIPRLREEHPLVRRLCRGCGQREVVRYGQRDGFDQRRLGAGRREPFSVIRLNLGGRSRGRCRHHQRDGRLEVLTGRVTLRVGPQDQMGDGQPVTDDSLLGLAQGRPLVVRQFRAALSPQHLGDEPPDHVHVPQPPDLGIEWARGPVGFSYRTLADLPGRRGHVLSSLSAITRRCRHRPVQLAGRGEARAPSFPRSSEHPPTDSPP